MPLNEIHRHPEMRRYLAPFFSAASVFQVLFTFIAVFGAFLVTYNSYNFWLKVDYYSEQPQVNFQYNMIVVLNQNNVNNVLAWSTFPNFNQMLGTSVRVPIVTAYEVDLYNSGRYNYLNLSISMPLQDAEQIYGVQVLLFFNYQLTSTVYLQMQSVGFINYESARPAAEFDYVGDLQFFQTQPLTYNAIDLRYNTSIFNSSSVFADAFDLNTVLANYTLRNVSTWLQSSLSKWTSGRSSGQPFRLNARINYVIPVVQYAPGFWQNIEWVWMQYVPILLLFLFVLDRVRGFVFHNQLVDTVVIKSFDSN